MSASSETYVYPIFLECSKYSLDPFWIQLYTEMAKGKFPRGTTVINNKMYLRSKTFKTSIYISQYEDSPEKLFLEVTAILKDWLNMSSSSDKTKKIKEQEDVRKEIEESYSVPWSRIKSKMIRDTLLTDYVIDMKEKHNLTLNETRDLRSFINIMMTFKEISSNDIEYRGGKIINITSIDALHPSSVGLAHYDASKHGVWGFTKNIALELAQHKIWVNAIAPGGIMTPGVQKVQRDMPISPDVDMKKLMETFLAKIPMRRMGEPDDIGRVALFLASDLSSYMTGTQVVVDGGVLLS